MFAFDSLKFDSISQSSDGKYNPNRPRDVIRKISSDSYRAPSVISGHSKASEQSRASNISRKSHVSNGSMQQMIGDAKKDFRDSIYESCITGGPLGPARTKEEIRNRKTLLISIVTGLFLVILFLILKEVAYNKQKMEDEQEIEELEKENKVNGQVMGVVPGAVLNPGVMMHPGVVPGYVPGYNGLPVGHNPIFPNQMSIMHEQHKLLQQLAGKLPINPQTNQNIPAQNVPVPPMLSVQNDQHINNVPQMPQAAAQIAVENPDEQFLIQNEGTQEHVDRFANMYAQIETLLASFVDTISSYTKDLTSSSPNSEEKALNLLNQEKNKMIKFLTKEEQHFQSKVSEEKQEVEEELEKEEILENSSTPLKRDFEVKLGQELRELAKAEMKNARRKQVGA